MPAEFFPGGQNRVSTLVWRQVRQTVTWIGPNLINLVRPAAYVLLSLGLGGPVGLIEYKGQSFAHIDYVTSHVLYGLVWFSFRSGAILGVAMLFSARPDWGNLPLSYLWAASGVAMWAALGSMVGIRVLLQPP